MDNFEKMLHDMFDHIWNREIEHPIFQDTVGDLMEAVIEAHKKARLDDDCISRKMAVEAIEGIVSSMSVCFSVDECHGMKRMQKRAIEEVMNLPAIQNTNHIADVGEGDSNDVTIY